MAQQHNKMYVSPYNDYQIVCGQGTVGLELLAAQPDLDAVFVAVGGGGLIGGIGSYIKAINPNIDIIGCWPSNATTFYQALEQGKVIEVEEQDTLSDGTAGGVEQDTITLPMCQQVIDHKVLVSEQQIAQAMQLAAVHERYMIEGAAAVALAAAIQEAPKYAGKKIAVVLCGRNIMLSKFLEVVG
jgi:threonine dehydratase